MRARALFSAAGAALAAVGFGQAVITSGSSSFGFPAAGDINISGATTRTGTGGGNGNFVPQGAADNLFQTWWWYRVDNATPPAGGSYADTREYAFSRLQSKNVTGNNMTLNYSETSDGTANGFSLFDASIFYTITNNGSGGSLVTAVNTITNQSGNPLTLSLFGYVDYDVPASSSTNTAVFAGDLSSGRFVVTGTTQIAEYRFLNASAYQVSSYSTVRGLLANTSIDNLNNTGLPFASGDFTGAVEWNVTLGVRESISLMTSYVANPVPEPATMLALAGGLALLARRRRRA